MTQEKDMFAMKKEEFQGCEENIIINTSCEHIHNFSEWFSSLPSGFLVVLQSNNQFYSNQHVNCVVDLEEFIDQTPFQVDLFSGSLDLLDYTRFMRVGITQ